MPAAVMLYSFKFACCCNAFQLYLAKHTMFDVVMLYNFQSCLLLQSHNYSFTLALATYVIIHTVLAAVRLAFSIQC